MPLSALAPRVSASLWVHRARRMLGVRCSSHLLGAFPWPKLMPGQGWKGEGLHQPYNKCLWQGRVALLTPFVFHGHTNGGDKSPNHRHNHGDGTAPVPVPAYPRSRLGSAKWEKWFCPQE